MRPLGVVVLLLALLLLIGAGGRDPDSVDMAHRFAAVSLAHPFGTDHLGRDMLARLLAGGRNAVLVVTLTATLGLTAGVGLGAAMSLTPPWLSGLLHRLTDLVLTVPSLVTALVATALFGLSPLSTGLALALTAIAATAQVSFSLISALHAAPHVRAAEALGGTGWHITARHILPDIAPSLLVLQCYHAARTLLAWSGLTFLGLGGDTSRPDWGSMVWDYRLFLFDHASLPLMPAAAIGLLAFALSRLGDPDRTLHRLPCPSRQVTP